MELDLLRTRSVRGIKTNILYSITFPSKFGPFVR